MAGIAILGSVLAFLVVARSRYLHQWTLAGRKQDAITAADGLLNDWWADVEKFPRESRGELPSQHLRWQTRRIDNPSLADLGVEAIRLEIFDADRDEQSSGDPRDSSVPPLIGVELMLDKPAVPAGARAAGELSEGVLRP